MKAPIRFATTALVAATCLFGAQAKADITAVQARQLGEMAAMQSLRSMAMGLTYMVTITEGCAQIYPSLRSDADAAYARLPG
ncbi:hypothetical protein, partial [Salmonella enterica]